MDDNNSTSPASGSAGDGGPATSYGITETVLAGGSDIKVRSYAIAPEDAEIADRIRNIDPVDDLPGPGSVKGSRPLPDISINGLSPAMREEVKARLVGVPTADYAEAEKSAIQELLTERRVESRILSGVGGAATDYHREWVAISQDYRALAREYNLITQEMTRVSHYDTVVNEQGKAEAKPVYAMSEARQIGSAKYLADLSYRMGLLVKEDGTHGVEAERRLQRALYDSVEQEKSNRARIEEHAEAKRRADDILREERINKRAEMFAKHKRQID